MTLARHLTTPDQLPLFQHTQKRSQPPFVCIDPEGKGRPWNGKGRRPDYVKKALRETGMYPVAKPDPDSVSATELARLHAKHAALVDLFTKHVRETTREMQAMQRRIEVLEQVEPIRRAA